MALSEQRSPCGIIAGAGPLPIRLAENLQRAGRSFFLIALEGFADRQRLSPFPHVWKRMGEAAEILDVLQAHNCREVVLVGPVLRPSWRQLRPTAGTLRLLGRLGRRYFSGDDGLLSGIAELLEKEGFCVSGADKYLSEEERPGPEWNVSASLDVMAHREAILAWKILESVAPFDFSQGCVVAGDRVLALEGPEGTDRMLERVGEIRREHPGMILKRPKKGQDMRVDLPTVGPVTLEKAREAGLNAVLWEEGRIFLIEPARCRELAARYGLMFGAVTLTSLK